MFSWERKKEEIGLRWCQGAKATKIVVSNQDSLSNRSIMKCTRLCFDNHSLSLYSKNDEPTNTIIIITKDFIMNF